METVKKRGNKQIPPGPGRPKGLPNKMTRQLKEMILDALEKSGGVAYLVTQAKENPKAFMSLIGRVLPLQVTGANGAELVVITKDYTGRKRDE